MNKKITIIPMEENSENFFNILPASEFIPDWYRKSPSKIYGIKSELHPLDPSVTSSTYKRCTPFFDAMSAGYMVYLTADIEILKKDDGAPFIMWRTKRNIVTEHSIEQWQGLQFPEGYHQFVFKWHNQFSIKSSKEYSLLFVNPINRFDLPFLTITGMVDCDLYNGSVQFPFFIKSNFFGIIEKGTPIAQIIPVKRDSWIREHTKYDSAKAEFMRQDFLSTIIRSYKKNNWVRKNYK